jgi:hypothetical protein
MEFNFQKIVLTIAIVVFIILMIFIATVLYNSKFDVKFPPNVSQCPDYWIDQQTPPEAGSISNTSNQTCVNVKNLGNMSCSKTMNFTDSYWQGATGDCNKSNWAKSCDLTWDGITTKPDICKL